MRGIVWCSRGGVRPTAEGENLVRAATRGAGTPCRKEASTMTIVWILIVIILVLLVIGLARRVL
jgi:hypothetical protein